jgi:response regulator of citrate/malate metabolism
MRHEQIDVLIVEDENELAQLHAELIGKHPRLRLVGIATSLAEARRSSPVSNRSWYCSIIICRTEKGLR